MAERLSPAAYLQRFLQVMAVLLRLAWRWTRRRLRGQPTEGPLLLREALEDLSGSFIKFGQILALQIETLPREYCDALLSLLDRVPPFPLEDVERIFRADLGKSPRDLFQEFNPKVLASASIGQVHRGILLDGTKVAVKVQRPGVRRDFERDVLMMQVFIKIVFLFRIRRLYFMRDPIRELSTWTQDELDYRREAAYCKLLGDNAVHTPSERVPRVYWELTTPRILTMDFLEGPSVATYLRMVEDKDEKGLELLRAGGFIPSVFSSNVISNFLSDAFRFGVFHADLHPANLLILPNNTVGYVDFGIVAVLTPEARRKQIELTLAYSSGDAESIYQGFLNICIIDEKADLAGLRKRIEELAAIWYQEPAIAGKVRFRVSVTTTMMDLLTVCQDYGVLVDREMIKYIRSTILADGLVNLLAPGVDLARILRNVVEDYLAGEARGRVLSKGAALAFLADLSLWMDAGPASFLRALNQFERGQLRIRTSLQAVPDKFGALRTRTITTAAVWGITILGLSWGGGWAALGSGPLFPTVAGVFMASLTLRLMLLLWKLTAK